MSDFAKQFAKELFAAFPHAITSAETKKLYTDKLSRWKMTETQWTQALDKLIEEHQQESIPALSEIYRYLKNQISFSSTANDKGWLYFDSGGYTYAVRVKYDNGIWVNAPAGYTNPDGKYINCQSNPRQVPKLPIDATNIIVMPDNLELIHIQAA